MRRLIPLLLLCGAAIAQTLPNAVPMPTPEIQYLNAAGQPLAGAFLCSFAAGTSTPLATYTDSTATTPNTNPVVLDSNGRASVWVGPSLYKFILYVGGNGACPGTGAVQWSQDNVSDTTLYFVNWVKTAVTATLITYTPPFTGGVTETVSTALSHTISIKDFGAVGDGVTNDTAAIQAALNWASQSNTLVTCPAGNYLVNGGGVVIPANVRFSGVNQGAVTGYGSGGCRLTVATAGTVLGTVASAGTGVYESGGVDHVYLDCHGLGTVGLYVGLGVFLRIHDITTDSCTVAGTIADATQNSIFESIDNRSSPIGLYVINGAASNLFERIENELTTVAPIRLATDATYPNHTFVGAVFGALQNTFERCIFDDGGTYTYALDAINAVSNTFSDDGFTDAPGGGTSAVLHFGSATYLNRVVRPSIQMSHDVLVISNAGNYNQFLNGDVTLVTGCHAISTSAATVISGWFAASGDTISGSCFYNNAVSTSGLGPSYSYSYTPIQQAGPTLLQPQTIPGVPINTYFNTSVTNNSLSGTLQSFNGSMWYPIAGYFQESQGTTLMTLTTTLTTIAGTTQSLPYNGWWVIDGYADVICMPPDLIELHLNVDSGHDVYFGGSTGATGPTRNMLSQQWLYQCTTCSSSPVSVYLQIGTISSATGSSQVSGGSTHITARYLHP